MGALEWPAVGSSALSSPLVELSAWKGSGYQPCSGTAMPQAPLSPPGSVPRPGPHLVLVVGLGFVAMWWLGGHVSVDCADGCRLRERMSGQDGAADVDAAPGQFLTRTLAPVAPPA